MICYECGTELHRVDGVWVDSEDDYLGEDGHVHMRSFHADAQS